MAAGPWHREGEVGDRTYGRRIRGGQDDSRRQTGNKFALCMQFEQKKHVKQLFPNFMWSKIPGTGWTCAEMHPLNRKFCRFLKVFTPKQYPICYEKRESISKTEAGRQSTL